MANPDSPQVQLERTYNAAADHYDHPALSFWDRFGRRTVERLPLVPGMRVLDVCCGMGGSALPAAERVRETGHVTAVDLAQNLLDKGAKRAVERGLANIEFRRADLENLPFAANPSMQSSASLAYFLSRISTGRSKDCIQPHLPQGWLTVVPQLPKSLPHLSIENLRIGDKILAVAAQRLNKLYVTEVTLPACCRLEIGHALEGGVSIESVTLNGEATDYEVRSTHKGSEVFARVSAPGSYRLVIRSR